LKIGFSDGGIDDFAVLEPFGANSRQFETDPKNCIFSGYLLEDSNVSVTIAGGCPFDDSFEVSI